MDLKNYSYMAVSSRGVVRENRLLSDPQHLLGRGGGVRGMWNRREEERTEARAPRTGCAFSSDNRPRRRAIKHGNLVCGVILPRSDPEARRHEMGHFMKKKNSNRVHFVLKFSKRIIFVVFHKQPT